MPPWDGRWPGPARSPDVRALRSRVAVELLLKDMGDVVRYQLARWRPRPHGEHRRTDPALHPHRWTALADDADIMIGWLTELRDTAREEAARLNTLNGDT